MAGKACVIFSPTKEAEAEQVVVRLRAEGYDVCAITVTPEVAAAAKEGSSSLPTDIAACIAGAEVCVILVDVDPGASSALGGLGGMASDGGSRVVTVGGDPKALSAELDDIIDGHVPSPETPELIDIVGGRPDRIAADNTPADKRNEDRVKCQ